MSERTGLQAHFDEMARNTLGVFEDIASNAENALSDPHQLSATDLARNTFTDQHVVRATALHNEARYRNNQILADEPAIARIVTRDDRDKVEIYFVTRGTPPNRMPPGCKITSLNAPMGRVASLPVGDDFEIATSSGCRVLTIMERAELHPERYSGDWDSVDTVLEGGFKKLTVRSLRALLVQALEGEDLDELEAALARGTIQENLIEGVRRSVISKMELRDQPILDKFQDGIFRLPLNKRLLLLGPPGTGKTTTLIRRLHQKLSSYLDDDEQRQIQATGLDIPHSQSWLMFTPTELLKQYVKEAFAREGVAAPETRIATWAAFRRELARSRFGVLKTSTGSGSFVLTETKTIANDAALARQIAWYSDFLDWQRDNFWSGLDTSARVLASHGEAETAAIGKRLLTLLQARDADSEGVTFAAIADLADRIRSLVDAMTKETDSTIRIALNTAIRTNPQFLEELGRFISGFSEAPDDTDDAEAEEEEEAQAPVIGARVAVNAYERAVRALSRAEVAKRQVSTTSRSGRILSWVANRLPSPEERLGIGGNLRIQDALRSFLNPMKRYLDGLPKRYRRYRKVRQEEGLWYAASGFGSIDISPLEVDLVLLSTLQTANALLSDRTIASNIFNPRYAALAVVKSLHRNQILVDEATDFSPIQLACMGTLANPATRSFFACGDFNQRITLWGVQSEDEFKWAFSDIDIRTVETTYRHSRQLNELAKALFQRSSGAEAPSVLPDRTNNDAVKPVLGLGLDSVAAKVEWLAARMVEIEALTSPLRRLPTVAILASSDDEGEVLARHLSEKLAPHTISVVACPSGRIIGHDGDVRVFDVQHIKGLEFEAVFFVDIDTLAMRIPQLFDKFLYVGATRAATYFGLTCSGSGLPTKLSGLESHFARTWEASTLS